MDMDAFYAAVEVRDHPELKGKPVIVGGPNRRGVVSTASYEARTFGVHSAMPMAQAMRQCPQAIVMPVRMDVYASVSDQIMAVLGEFSPLVEPLSLDEAFLDMTGTEALLGPAAAVGQRIKDRVRRKTQLTASVGIACNKFLAKLASDLEKPNGLTIVPRGSETAFIAPLPIKRLWGVGPKTASILEAAGLRTIGEVARAEPSRLRTVLGANLANHLIELSHAQDDRPVVPWHDPKSIGSERTLDQDIRGRQAVLPVLREQCERVAQRMRAEHLVAGAVRVKIRWSRTFRLATREASLRIPSDDSGTLFTTAASLLDKFELDEPIRLVGAAAADLRGTSAPQQGDLFEHSGAVKRSKLEHTLDAIRDRYGEVIQRGKT